MLSLSNLFSFCCAGILPTVLPKFLIGGGGASCPPPVKQVITFLQINFPNKNYHLTRIFVLFSSTGNSRPSRPPYSENSSPSSEPARPSAPPHEDQQNGPRLYPNLNEFTQQQGQGLQGSRHVDEDELRRRRLQRFDR